jgi:hypothetical protein
VSIASVALLFGACGSSPLTEVTNMAVEDDFSVTRTGDREITIRRTFAASPTAVFEAMTEPAQAELLASQDEAR